jgi:hypothetical protein
VAGAPVGGRGFDLRLRARDVVPPHQQRLVERRAADQQQLRGPIARDLAALAARCRDVQRAGLDELAVDPRAAAQAHQRVFEVGSQLDARARRRVGDQVDADQRREQSHRRRPPARHDGESTTHPPCAAWRWEARARCRSRHPGRHDARRAGASLWRAL